MTEEKDYIQILNRARKKRRKNPYGCYLGIAAAIIAAVVLAAVMVLRMKGIPANDEPAAQATASNAEALAQENLRITQEEEEAQKIAAKKQAVVDSYSNLGLVQVSGYLNVRETPEANGKIIGKLQENSACEILGTEGEWLHITSGGIEGYIHSQYVLTGEEARTKALDYVEKRAIVHVKEDSLNIRQEPNTDSNANIVGQALNNERYVVEEELDGWVKISSGYISADYVTVQYALNEARELDLKTMALNQYEDLVISKVDSYLNIRSEPNTDSNANIIGKFPSKAAGEILETLDGWYKIKSGPITGYVSAEHVATGQEARDIAVQEAQLMAIVNTDRLNVRSEPSLDSKIWTQISKEERYPVQDQLDGWVEIELDAGDSDSSDRAFISTRDNNVEVRYALNEAIKFSPLEEQANKQSSLRSKVVNFGLQFVGNRYVWGGTNPNTGADCSGFVQYVMRNAAGVSLPRTSREQAKVGRAVKSGEMLPGDLIFYTNKSGTVNHVAMYIGNGQIVHAASRKSGIKISTWNYRTPKYIRRVLN
ncbi:MAG: SH3 domain-containing protein [Lachnospiraceae bacterium]|nr:SH3 domain-containing protein [Lachnospiraceae bacterium]